MLIVHCKLNFVVDILRTNPSSTDRPSTLTLQTCIQSSQLQVSASILTWILNMKSDHLHNRNSGWRYHCWFQVQVRQFLGAECTLEPIPSLFSAAPDDRLAGLLVVGFVNGHSTTTWTTYCCCSLLYPFTWRWWPTLGKAAKPCCYLHLIMASCHNFEGQLPGPTPHHQV